MKDCRLRKMTPTHALRFIGKVLNSRRHQRRCAILGVDARICPIPRGVKGPSLPSGLQIERRCHSMSAAVRSMINRRRRKHYAADESTAP